MTNVNLPQLQQELAAAQVSVPHGLVTIDGTLEGVRTPTGVDGGVTFLPPAATPVLSAHSAAVQTTAYVVVSIENMRTTDAVVVTLASWPLAVQTLYTARFTILAVDTGNGDCRVWYAKASARRLGAGALLVGTPSIDTDHPNPGATSWAIAADTNGNNFRVRVTGAAGRTISWNLVGEVLRARPTGLVD